MVSLREGGYEKIKNTLPSMSQIFDLIWENKTFIISLMLSKTLDTIIKSGSKRRKHKKIK